VSSHGGDYGYFMRQHRAKMTRFWYMHLSNSFPSHHIPPKKL